MGEKPRVNPCFWGKNVFQSKSWNSWENLFFCDIFVYSNEAVQVRCDGYWETLPAISLAFRVRPFYLVIMRRPGFLGRVARHAWSCWTGSLGYVKTSDFKKQQVRIMFACVFACSLLSRLKMVENPKPNECSVCAIIDLQNKTTCFILFYFQQHLWLTFHMEKWWKMSFRLSGLVSQILFHF